MTIRHLPPGKAVHVITVGAQGQVQAMQNDAFNMGIFGHQRVQRATEILFDDVAQSWYIEPRDDAGNPVVGPVPRVFRDFVSYTSARDCEVRWMNLRALNDHLDKDPLSVEGRHLMYSARYE